METVREAGSGAVATAREGVGDVGERTAPLLTLSESAARRTVETVRESGAGVVASARTRMGGGQQSADEAQTDDEANRNATG